MDELFLEFVSRWRRAHGISPAAFEVFLIHHRAALVSQLDALVTPGRAGGRTAGMKISLGPSEPEGRYLVSGWPDAPAVLMAVPTGPLPWDERRERGEFKLAFRTEELARRAADLPLAEAATLHHAQYRLHEDPFEPHEMTVRWKILNDIPLTDSEKFLITAETVAAGVLRDARRWSE